MTEQHNNLDESSTLQEEHREHRGTDRWWYTIARNPLSPIVIVFGLLVFRVVWQYVSPYTLIEDEAHYWEWSRRLDWSYYSKGPGVAWTIWISTTLFGASEWAIRIPAAVACALGSVAVWRMAKEHLSDQRYVFLSAVLYSCVPGFAVASMIMTIDSPYIACWAWASLFAIRAILTEKQSVQNRSWIWFGLCIAIGFIYKYTILMLIPGVVFAWWMTRKHRQQLGLSKLSMRWVLVGCVFALLGLIPVGVWNANHDWATIRHLLGHLGAPGGDTRTMAHQTGEPWTILWMLEFIALQLLVGGPVFMLGFFAWVNSKKWADVRTALVLRTMIAMGLPLLVFYFCVSLVAQTEGNWPMAAFVTMIPPAAWAIIDGIRRVDHPVKFAWGASLTVGVGVLLLFPGASWLSSRVLFKDVIPIERMSGMREHAEHVQVLVEQLREDTNQEPIVMCNHYGRASLLAFYLPDHPVVFCTSAQVGGRKTQYDMWKDTDLADPETNAGLQGRPGVLIGGQEWKWTPAFDDLVDLGMLRSEPKENQSTYIGLNYRTFESWIPPHLMKEEEGSDE